MKKKSKPNYSAPKLVRIGRLEKITQSKAGTKADGAAKPSTKLTGTAS